MKSENTENNVPTSELDMNLLHAQTYQIQIALSRLTHALQLLNLKLLDVDPNIFNQVNSNLQSAQEELLSVQSILSQRIKETYVSASQ
jgi:hypothetical protein